MDVADGLFVPEKTIGPEDLNQVDTIVNFDVHLMVNRPEDWVERCVASGVDRVFGQVEKMVDPVTFIASAQSEGLAVGLAYDIETPLEGLEKYINDIDAVLLMSVKAGAQGREFDERVLEKIKQVRQLDKRKLIIIDGGLNEDNIRKCLIAEWAEEIAEDELLKETTSMEFVVGMHLLSAENPVEELEKLRLVEHHNH